MKNGTNTLPLLPRAHGCEDEQGDEKSHKSTREAFDQVADPDAYQDAQEKNDPGFDHWRASRPDHQNILKDSHKDKVHQVDIVGMCGQFLIERGRAIPILDRIRREHDQERQAEERTGERKRQQESWRECVRGGGICKYVSSERQKADDQQNSGHSPDGEGVEGLADQHRSVTMC